MPNMLSDFKRYLLRASLALLFASTTSYAEMYKWVDADGNTHYSDKKEDTGKAKVEKLKIKASPNPTSEPASSIPGWQDKESEHQKRLVQKQIEQQIEQKESLRVANKPKKAWGGDQVETDATRCALARDILSGAARLTNGVATDSNDRELAQNDVRNYCH